VFLAEIVVDIERAVAEIGMPSHRRAQVSLQRFFQLDAAGFGVAPGQGAVERGAFGFARKLEQFLADDRNDVAFRDQVEKLIPKTVLLAGVNGAHTDAAVVRRCDEVESKKKPALAKANSIGAWPPPEFYLRWKLQHGCATCGADEERSALIASVCGDIFLPCGGVRRQQRAGRRGVFGGAGGQVVSRDPARTDAARTRSARATQGLQRYESVLGIGCAR